MQNKPSGKLIQHLGLVAGMCKEVNLAERIDRLIPKPNRTVSIGQIVVAMILNALGFTGRAMYLTKHFFKNRPVEELIGPGVTADKLHDNSLGTALDEIYKFGITELFFAVAMAILRDQGIETRFSHLDSSTLSLYGKYNSQTDDKDIDAKVIHITKGHSKENRPELNQVVVQLICSNRSNIPMWVEALSGNTSDKESFRKTVKKFQKEFKKQGTIPYIVMDSAFYTRKNLEACIDDLKWVTRVPETLSLVKSVYEMLDKTIMRDLGNGYAVLELEQEYAGVPQRWVMVSSDKSRKREMATFEKNLQKTKERSQKDLKHLRNRVFACEADALKAAECFMKKQNFQSFIYQVTGKPCFSRKGRPANDAQPEYWEWYIEGTLEEDREAINKARKKKGLFIIATNEMDCDKLPTEDLLSVYKDQGVSVERGFRFLKDPLFYAESLYLEKPERIMALVMVMTLSLLIYALAERKVRKVLAENDIHIYDQKNKPTKRPTIRWVFMVFDGVLLFYSSDIGPPISINIGEEHENLLKCLGPTFQKMYFL